MSSYTSKIDQPFMMQIEGVIDNTNASQFADELLSAATNAENSTFVLDLTAVTFINSIGIGGLIKLHQIVKSRNLTLRVLVGRTVGDVLQVAKLGQVFPVEVVSRLK